MEKMMNTIMAAVALVLLFFILSLGLFCGFKLFIIWPKIAFERGDYLPLLYSGISMGLIYKFFDSYFA